MSTEDLRTALAEADRIMGHDDNATEWREKWARLWGASSAAAVPAGWVPMCERAPAPDTDCAVFLRYTMDRQPFVAMDRWEMLREDPTGMGGPTLEMGYGWRDNFEGDVIAWYALPPTPPAEWDQRHPDAIDPAATPAPPQAAVPATDAEPWHYPRADKLREALREIADTKNLTATSERFIQHLQRVACRALTDDAMNEPAPAAPAAVNAAPELPMLPEPRTLSRGDEDGALQLGYTADQMREYARAALRAAGAGSREPLTDEEICALAIECGHATEVLDAGYPNNTLWFNGDLIPFARAVLGAARGKA